MDKQRNQLIKAYTRTRKQANSGYRYYEMNYAYDNPDFDIIDYDKYNELEHIAFFIAKNPLLIHKFQKQIKDFNLNHTKVVLSHHPELHKYFKDIIPQFNYSQIEYVLNGQKKRETDLNPIVDMLGSYRAFENISTKQFVEMLTEHPNIFDTVEKYFKVKFLSKNQIFDLLVYQPKLIDKDAINVNKMTKGDVIELTNAYPELKNHPKIINYEHEESLW